MKIFFDTEFTGLHKDTSLISIGLVDENGKTFYAEFLDYNQDQVNDWIRENVINHLSFNLFATKLEVKNGNTEMKGPKKYVADCLKIWLANYDDIQLVSDVCHYDMVLFIDMFGDAFSIPENVSPVCHDINQDIATYYNISEKEAFDKSREEISDKIEGDKHNALYDAKVIKNIYYKLRK